MGLLDSVLGSVLRGGGQARGGDPKMALIMGLLTMLTSKGAGASQQAGQGGLGSILGGMLGGQASSGGGLGSILGGMLGTQANAAPASGLDGAFGGLSGIQDVFKRAGLGQQVDSWISTGDNLPVSADQIRQALGGSGHLKQLAETAGMSEAEAANDLSDVLPDLINQLTPDGNIPQGGADIEALLKKMMA